MSEAMKARLIGAVVLVVLGFVALNALLGGLAPSEGEDEPVVIIRPQAKPPQLAKPRPAEQPAASSEEPPDTQAPQDQPSPKAAPEPAPKTQPKPQPKADPKPEPKPQPTTAPEPKPNPAPRPEPKPEPTTKPQPKPKPDPAPKPASKPAGHWWVQVASFGDADNANRMIADLRGAGFDTDRTRVTVGGRTYTRVLAGPFATERAAESARARIAVRFGASGRVVERR